MGNIHTFPTHKDIPEAPIIPGHDIRRKAREIFNRMQARSKTIDLQADPWLEKFKDHYARQPFTMSKVSSALPGLGTALGIFGVYCLLEQLGLFDDGGWSAWTHKEHHD